MNNKRATFCKTRNEKRQGARAERQTLQLDRYIAVVETARAFYGLTFFQ